MRLGLYLWFVAGFKLVSTNVCTLQPLGEGLDDTDQIEAAISQCGHYGTTTFAPGEYNVTRKMTWDLVESRVDLHGYLNVCNVPRGLWSNNRVIFIQVRQCLPLYGESSRVIFVPEPGLLVRHHGP